MMFTFVFWFLQQIKAAERYEKRIEFHLARVSDSFIAFLLKTRRYQPQAQIGWNTLTNQSREQVEPDLLLSLFSVSMWFWVVGGQLYEGSLRQL